MKKIGQFLQRLFFYVIAAVFILNFRRLFANGRFSFFPMVIVIALVFLVFAWGMMQTMFAGADDSLERKGEIPAPSRKIYPKPAEPTPEEWNKEEIETWEAEAELQEYPPKTFTLILPAGRLTVQGLRGTPLSATGIDLEEFCRLFNEASKTMGGDVQTDVTVDGIVFSMKVYPSAPPVPHRPWQTSSSPKEPRPSYKKIAEEIGTEADLRELERQEREELKRLNKGQ